MEQRHVVTRKGLDIGEAPAYRLLVHGAGAVWSRVLFVVPVPTWPALEAEACALPLIVCVCASQKEQ